MLKQPHYAGFWSRLWASLIDSVWLSFVIFGLLFWLHSQSTPQVSAHTQTLTTLINWLIPALLIIACWFFRATSPGKFAISAKIVDAKTCGKANFWQLLVRYLAYFLSLTPFGMGFIWVGLDEKKQGWHDKIAGTLVLRDIAHTKRQRLLTLSSVILVALVSYLTYALFITKLSDLVFRKSDPSFQAYIDDGFAFGEGESEETCWQEARWRIGECPDLYCKFGQVYFLKACLAASEASRSTANLNR